ncbi:hypothetical protein [Actinomadura gamaensis]|uniref:Uncharacterized protein n=1 Tax=Actinomadura gamaensis TaxID=1763541 RepID=A0ABV9U5K9_9ACTN
MGTRTKVAVVTAGAVTTAAAVSAALLWTGGGGHGAAAPVRLDAGSSGPASRAVIAGRYVMPSGGESSASFAGLAAAHGRVWMSGTEGPIGKAGSPTGFVLRYENGRLTRLKPPLTPGHSDGGAVAAAGDRAWILASDRKAGPLLATDGRGWHWDARPARGGLRPYTVAAIGDRDVWIAASESPSSGDSKDVTALLHYNGGDWRRTDKGVGGDSRLNLFDLTARASNDVWVAGERSTSTGKLDAEPYLAHWDGRAWKAHTAIPVRLGFVRAVAPLSGTNVWAVGGVGCACSSDAGPLVLHYDGRTWRKTSTSGLSLALQAVVPDGRGGLWGVESDGRVLRFNGRHWKAVALPEGAEASALSRDASTGRVYAAAAQPMRNDKVTGFLLELR